MNLVKGFQEIWLIPTTKSPTPAENFKEAKWQHKNDPKMFYDSDCGLT